MFVVCVCLFVGFIYLSFCFWIEKVEMYIDEKKKALESGSEIQFFSSNLFKK